MATDGVEKEHTRNAVTHGVANFVLVLHVNFDGHQHWMYIELKCDHAVDFQQRRKGRCVQLNGRYIGCIRFFVQ